MAPRDVPHLAVVFDDDGARVGPLVEPGAGPCLRCLDLGRRDADPAWPAIAAQLAGRPAATGRPRAPRSRRSTLAVAVVDDRLAHGSHARSARASLALSANDRPTRRAGSGTRRIPSADAELLEEPRRLPFASMRAARAAASSASAAAVPA